MNLRATAVKLVLLAIGAGALPYCRTTQAQLAITEMMSAHFSPADFFELTNFGTNIVSLDGYKFTDADHRNDRQLLIGTNKSVVLAPGESMIFFRARTNFNVVDFRQFWASCLDSNVQVFQFVKPGFSSFGDALTIYDAEKHVVDNIEFGRADRTVSFVYDPQTGVFGVRSSPGNGGCLSAANENLASPGRTTGAVPLQITNQPLSVAACENSDVRFGVAAIGMPPPRFQWFWNGTVLAGETAPTLVVSNININMQGAYTVRVSNGLSNILSAEAILTVSTNPTSPALIAGPLDTTVVEGSTARFAIELCSYPAAAYQWFSNGVPLIDETNRVLFVRNVDNTMSSSVFCVRAQNELGFLERCAALYVTNVSPIRITEVQTNPAPGCDGHNDWFEITNFGGTDADLSGYRFSDQFSLSDAQVIKRPLFLKAHESVIFVKNSSVGTFFEWWGPDQLPDQLQVLPYSGFSLGADGDVLYLWNATAEDPAEYVDSVVFPRSAPGVTFNLEVDSPARPSALGQDEAIQAVQCNDIGSPGFTSDSPPEFTLIHPSTDGVHLAWRSTNGGNLWLQFTDRLGGGWSNLVALPAGHPARSLTDTTFTNSPARFYRLRVEPIE